MGFNYQPGREHVVIPWAIDGADVTIIGNNSFAGKNIASIVVPKTVTDIDHAAFINCSGLTGVTINGDVRQLKAWVFMGCSGLSSLAVPSSVTAISQSAFAGCSSLTNLVFEGCAPGAVEADAFLGTHPDLVATVTNPQATGWGDKLGDMPVVRLPLYGDKIYQAGELVATTGDVAQAIAGKVDRDGGTATNLWLQGETVVSDSYTNLWWRNVFSNGWHWLVAYTNAPGGGE